MNQPENGPDDTQCGGKTTQLVKEHGSSLMPGLGVNHFNFKDLPYLIRFKTVYGKLYRLSQEGLPDTVKFLFEAQKTVLSRPSGQIENKLNNLLVVHFPFKEGYFHETGQITELLHVGGNGGSAEGPEYDKHDCRTLNQCREVPSLHEKRGNQGT